MSDFWADFKGQKPEEDKPASKSPWRQLVDYVKNTDWGNVSDVASEGLTTGEAGLAGLADDTVDFARTLSSGDIRPVINVVKRRVQGTPAPLEKAVTAAVVPKVRETPTSRTAEIAGRTTNLAVQAAPFAIEAPLATAISAFGGGVGGQVGKEAFPNNPYGETLGEAVGAFAGGIPAAGRAIKNFSDIRAIKADPDYQHIVNYVIPDIESNFNPNAVNKKSGARGSMQVMPDTAAKPGYGIPASDGTKAGDVRVAKDKYAVLVKMFKGDHEKALAAYNYGEGNVMKLVKEHGDDYFYHLPKETKDYVSTGMIKAFGGPRAVSAPGEGVPPVDIASAMPQEAPDNVVNLGKVRQSLDNQKVSDLIDEKLDSAVNHEDAVLHDESPMKLEEATSNREMAEQMHNMLDEDHPYRDRTQRLVDIWRNVENTLHERDRPLREHIGDFIQKGLDDLKNTPDNRALDDINKQWNDALEDLKADKISSDEYDARIKPLQAAHTAILKRLDDAHAEYIKGRDTKAQSYDAAEDRPVVDNTGYEKHTPYVGGPKLPANDPVERDTNPPASSSTVGTRRPEGVNRKPPTKSPEGHEGPSEEDKGLIARLIEQVNKAKPIRANQDRLMAREKAKRTKKASDIAKFTSGEAGFNQELSALSGQMPSADFESVRGFFSQPEIDRLHDIIKNDPHLDFYDKVNARAGLRNLLGEANHASVPTKSQLQLLGKVFPKELIDSLEKKAGLNPTDVFSNIINIPRSLMATFDFSALLRQGVFMVGRKEFYKAWPAMYKYFASQKGFDESMAEIASRPTFKAMQEAKLALANTGRYLVDREEAFMSKWVEDIFDLPKKIPGIGKYIPNPVKASDRAYVGFLNRLRADTFDTLYKKMQETGVDFSEDPKALKDLGKYLNNATGRGDIPEWIGGNRASPALSGLLFSPRLMAARVQMLNPAFYIKLHPAVRKEAVKSLLAFGAIANTVAGLAYLGGLKVDPDPRSTDFMKIRWGNTRFDQWGGFQQYIRAGAQLVSGVKVNADTHKKTYLGYGIPALGGKFEAPKGYKPTTRNDVMGDFLASKASPPLSLLLDLGRGTDPVGKPLTLQNEVIDKFIPLVTQDIRDAMKEHGAVGGAVVAPLAAHGVGVQTYDSKKKKKHKTNGPLESAKGAF